MPRPLPSNDESVIVAVPLVITAVSVNPLRVVFATVSVPSLTMPRALPPRCDPFTVNDPWLSRAVVPPVTVTPAPSTSVVALRIPVVFPVKVTSVGAAVPSMSMPIDAFTILTYR